MDINEEAMKSNCKVVKNGNELYRCRIEKIYKSFLCFKYPVYRYVLEAMFANVSKPRWVTTTIDSKYSVSLFWTKYIANKLLNKFKEEEKQLAEITYLK